MDFLKSYRFLSRVGYEICMVPEGARVFCLVENPASGQLLDGDAFPSFPVVAVFAGDSIRYLASGVKERIGGDEKRVREFIRRTCRIA